MEAVSERTESFDFTDMLHLACNEEAAFLSLVKTESAKIPLSVRMFLADRIRNALMGMEDEERVKVIENALDAVGI